MLGIATTACLMYPTCFPYAPPPFNPRSSVRSPSWTSPTRTSWTWRRCAADSWTWPRCVQYSTLYGICTAAHCGGKAAHSCTTRPRAPPPRVCCRTPRAATPHAHSAPLALPPLAPGRHVPCCGDHVQRPRHVHTAQGHVRHGECRVPGGWVGGTEAPDGWEDGREAEWARLYGAGGEEAGGRMQPLRLGSRSPGAGVLWWRKH